MTPRILAAIASCAAAVYGQTGPGYSIQAFAGMPRQLGDGGPANSALLWSPRGVSVDAGGNIYIADTGNARIRKVTPDGFITTLAGSVAGFSGDAGLGASAQLSFPSKAVAGINGDVYIADSANNRIRKVAANGVITTVAGTGSAGFTGDSVNAASVQLSFPADVAADANGNIYIADTTNGRIRRLTPQGRIETIAGSGLFGSTGDDGPAGRAAFEFPRGVAVDSGGTVYIADTLNNRIRKVTPDGTVSTIAGGNTAGFSGDFGPAIYAQLNRPTGVAVDNRGNVYLADTGNNRVRRISAQGVITTIAGRDTNGFRGDNGTATLALLNAPQSVAVTPAGDILIADTANHRIRKVDPQGIITTIAGSDPAAGDNGPALAARLFQPSGLAIDTGGNVYIADAMNHRVRRVSPQGVITTVAGTGSAGYSGDGSLASLAQLNNPNGLTLDRAGNLFIADTNNNVIRRVAGGIISTVAGTGSPGNQGDSGPAVEATLYNPNAVAFDRLGNMYIADSANNRIRIVANGIIRHFAGDPTGFPGFTGDSGPAGAARFDYPISLAIDDSGNIFVADYFNDRVRRISASGNTITTFAGNGTRGGAGDGGPAAQAQLSLPAGIAFDANRNLFIADLLNNRLRVVANGGIINTVAGSGTAGDAGDGGPALSALLASPRDVAVDALGNIYFSDQDNNRVRKLSPTTVSIKTIVNAASLIAGPVAPGEAITIFGSQLGSKVLFDGVPAVTLFSSPNQVNAVVPNTVAGKTSTRLQVLNEDLRGAEFTLTVRDAAPGIFTIDSSGAGQGAVVNEDGTINSAANPAAAGSIVSIYGTGQGAGNSATVRIQGLPAEVLYAGPAPGAIGLFQVNARIPLEAFPSNRTPIELVVGTFAAQPGVFIAVR